MTSRHRRRLPRLTAADCTPAAIAPVPVGVPRPLVSVMIPTFNCAALLRICLESVLGQDLGPERMQIEVVDDCSTTDDPGAVVRDVGGDRVTFTRNAVNLGATGNFNECLRRSRGELVHVLHGDDLVLPGFYDEILRLAAIAPAAGLWSTRSIVIDEVGTIIWVTPRSEQHEDAAVRDPGALASMNTLQFASTVMRRSAVEASGGFVECLVHTADWEMWLRLTGEYGLARSALPLACYREFPGAATPGLTRSAGNVLDYDALVVVAAATGAPADADDVLWLARDRALHQYDRFRDANDSESAKANFAYWVRRASATELAGFAWRRLSRRAR